MIIPVDANPQSGQADVMLVDTEDAATHSRQMEETIPVGRECASPLSQLTEVISTNETCGTTELRAIGSYILRNVDKATKAGKKQQQQTMEERIQNRRLRNSNSSQKSTNETSGTAQLCAIDFYNLRNVDNATKARKKQQQRMREERIQNRRLRKQREIREADEIVDRALKIREELRQERLKFEEKIKGKEDYYYYTPRWRKEIPISEVINPLPDFEWVPYESDNEFGRVSELKRTSWRVEEFTLQLAQCTVGLESFAGKKQLFSCSGTIVEFLMGIGYVVTSASLVKWPHEDKQADELKINVYLPSGETLEGTVSNVNFSYNICVVKVPSTLQLPTRSFSAGTRIFNFYDRCSRDVVALGHLCKPWSLNVALGKLIPRRRQFDCEELLVSSCRISKRGVGGPLMDFDGNIIGMNFYDKKETPFLPGFIVLKCLQHFNDFKKVIRPLHGLRVKTIYEEAQLTVLEKIQHGFPEVSGVIVEKVEVTSPEHSDIKVGDVITHVDGIPLSSAAELGGILLDKCAQHMLERQKLDLPKDGDQMATVISLKFDVKTMRGRSSGTTTRTINVDKFTPTSDFNSWPLGRPYFLRRTDKGILFTEKRYG